MTWHVHNLIGCSPRPLAHYLKALGILRLVSEQKDSAARGWWEDESFHLLTRLDRQELEIFFLFDYCPTPIIDPWNSGSGFYPGDNTTGMKAIEVSTADRFERFRVLIRIAKSQFAALEKVVERAKRAKKAADKDKSNPQLREVANEAEKQRRVAKANFTSLCRKTWRGPAADWLDAALVLTDEEEPAYPSMLGSGGNDGRLDFTNNFMDRLTELFDCESTSGPGKTSAPPLLQAALFGNTVDGLHAAAVGQFLPGGAGGANSTVGFSGKSLVNPWDFVLMLEGTVSFAAAVTRRATAQALPLASAPFALSSGAVGYATASEGEKNRGEQWMPLWVKPATSTEVVKLIAEGRCQVRRQLVQRPVDMARAIARLGVARGITAFERYAYIERNGQANLATPLGRWLVSDKPQPHQHLIDEIAPWVERLEGAAGDKNAPAWIARAACQCQEAIMGCCRTGSSAPRWQNLLIGLGEAESRLCQSPAFTARKGLQPLGAFGRGLNPEWLLAANDRSLELRLALSLAAQHGPQSDSQSSGVEPDRGNPIRRHFLPLEPPLAKAGRDWIPRRFHVSGKELAHDPAVVCHGHDLERDAIHLLRRRVTEARRELEETFPLVPVTGSEASLADIATFVEGQRDAARILALARPLMALDWSRFERQRDAIRSALGYPSDSLEREAADALAVWGLFRLCHHWQAVPVAIGSASDDEALRWVHMPIRLDPSIIPRLAGGDLLGAVTIAARRLKVSGLRPHLNWAAGRPDFARRLAAALVFPVSQTGGARLARRITRPTFQLQDAL